MFLVGPWKTFDELEDSLTINELFLLLNKAREQESERQYFAASLKGIDLRAAGAEAKRKEIEERAKAKINPNFEQDELAELGIKFE